MISVDERARESARALRASVAGVEPRAVSPARRGAHRALIAVGVAVVVAMAAAAVVIARDHEHHGRETHTFAPSGESWAVTGEGPDGATWSVRVGASERGETEVCWETRRGSGSGKCEPLAAFVPSKVVGQTGVRLLLRSVDGAVVSVTAAFDGGTTSALMLVGEGEHRVAITPLVAPATSVVVVGTSAEREEFRDEVHASAVPNVVGSSGSQAIRILRDAGFNMSGGFLDQSGSVVAQDPRPGVVDLNVGDVTIVVSPSNDAPAAAPLGRARVTFSSVTEAPGVLVVDRSADDARWKVSVADDLDSERPALCFVFDRNPVARPPERDTQLRCYGDALFGRTRIIGIEGLVLAVRTIPTDVTKVEMERDDGRRVAWDIVDSPSGIRLAIVRVDPGAATATILGYDSRGSERLREHITSIVMPNLLGLTMAAAEEVLVRGVAFDSGSVGPYNGQPGNINGWVVTDQRPGPGVEDLTTVTYWYEVTPPELVGR